MRRLFAGTGLRLSFSHEIARHPLRGAGALAEPLEHHAGVVGPLIALRRVAERRGSWPAVQADVAALCAADGERADGQYLVVLVARRLTCAPARGTGSAWTRELIAHKFASRSSSRRCHWASTSASGSRWSTSCGSA